MSVIKDNKFFINSLKLYSNNTKVDARFTEDIYLNPGYLSNSEELLKFNCLDSLLINTTNKDIAMFKNLIAVISESARELYTEDSYRIDISIDSYDIDTKSRQITSSTVFRSMEHYDERIDSLVKYGCKDFVEYNNKVSEGIIQEDYIKPTIMVCDNIFGNLINNKDTLNKLIFMLYNSRRVGYSFILFTHGSLNIFNNSKTPLSKNIIRIDESDEETLITTFEGYTQDRVVLTIPIMDNDNTKTTSNDYNPIDLLKQMSEQMNNTNRR